VSISWVTSSLSGTAQACSTEMYTGVSWPDNQWASVTSTSATHSREEWSCVAVT